MCEMNSRLAICGTPARSCSPSPAAVCHGTPSRAATSSAVSAAFASSLATMTAG
jgi:hypothetical protein